MASNTPSKSASDGREVTSSDITLNSSAFLGPPPAKAVEFNRQLIAMQDNLPKWWEIGADKYRAMRERGETTLPKPVLLEDAQDITIPSREAGRSIPMRFILPDGQSRGQQPGIYLHIHGGGWVLMSEKFQDPFLKAIANATGLAVLSIGYRLAPEHPFPQGNEDCYDVAEYLVDHSVKEFGAPLQFVGGESAGAHLSACVVLHLLAARPQFRFQGAILTYGAFNLGTPFPSRANFKHRLILTPETMAAYIDAFAPDRTDAERSHPSISPFWHPIFHWDEDTHEARGAEGLPPALFICGTMDPLLDDTVFMAARWQMAGAEATTRFWRGMPHGFNMFADDEVLPGSGEAIRLQLRWMKAKMHGGAKG